MILPEFPEFAPIELEMRDTLHPLLWKTLDGVSEFTFANLFLFRHKYHYQVSLIGDKNPILSGRYGDESFFMSPCFHPDRASLCRLFESHHYWRGISDTVLSRCRACLECCGIDFMEDRNNFDYLYLRTNLAELPGKKYHKKRNLCRAFESSYECLKRPLDQETVSDAMEVLQQWRQGRDDEGDFIGAVKALELIDQLELQGSIYYVQDRPIAWCLGESIARGKMLALHFEKALDEFKGAYQYMNRDFAQGLPESFKYLNREQDMGDPGLRQAKMSYRPSGFVRKYLGRKKPKNV